MNRERGSKVDIEGGEDYQTRLHVGMHEHHVIEH